MLNVFDLSMTVIVFAASRTSRRPSTARRQFVSLRKMKTLSDITVVHLLADLRLWRDAAGAREDAVDPVPFATQRALRGSGRCRRS